MREKSAIPLSPYSDPRNYKIALEQGRRNLAAGNPQEMAARSGCPFVATKSSFTVICLDHPFTVTYPHGVVKYKDSNLEPYFVLQIMMINYLSRADGTPLSYEYIPYRDLEMGNAYYAAFQKTAIQPLTSVFGSNPQRLQAAASAFGGVPHAPGSGTGVTLYLLPRIPLLYKVWPGDEEFPAQANILFDRTANHYLHTEDLAACDVVTRLLIRQTKEK